MVSEKKLKLISIFLMIGPIQLVILTFVAMLFYPGGTGVDPTILGNSFFSNYFSDLGGTVSHSGTDNTISMIFFAIAFIHLPLLTYCVSFSFRDFLPISL